MRQKAKRPLLLPSQRPLPVAAALMLLLLQVPAAAALMLLQTYSNPVAAAAAAPEPPRSAHHPSNLTLACGRGARGAGHRSQQSERGPTGTHTHKEAARACLEHQPLATAPHHAAHHPP